MSRSPSVSAGPHAWIASQQRLALLATAFAFPLGGATLLVPWLLFLKIVRIVKERGWRWVYSPYDWPIGGFLSLALVSVLLSPLRIVALESWALVVLAFGIVLQTLLEVLRESPEFVRFLHRAFALGALAAACYGLLVLLVLHPVRAHLLTLGGNALGFGLMAGVFLMLPLFCEPRPWPWIAAVAVVLASTTMIATLSRGALYGMVGGGIAYLAIEWRRFSLRSLAAVTLCLVLGLGLAMQTPAIFRRVAYQTLWWSNLERIQGPVSAPMIVRDALAIIISKEGNNDRLPVWLAAVRVIRDRPWFGVGLGVFPFVVHQWAPDVRPGTPPHSIYLDMAAEVGIPGAVAFLTLPLVAVVCGLSWRDSYRSSSLAAMVGMLAADVRDNILMGFHMALGFILLLAMLVPTARRVQPVAGAGVARELARAP